MKLSLMGARAANHPFSLQTEPHSFRKPEPKDFATPMNYIPFVLTLFGLLCAALSLVTRILFRPKTFYPPANRLSNAIWILYLLFSAMFFALSKTRWLPLWSSSDWLNFPTSELLILLHGQAIWHHFETATRTPSDLWEKFFRG